MSLRSTMSSTARSADLPRATRHGVRPAAAFAAAVLALAAPRVSTAQTAGAPPASGHASHSEHAPQKASGADTTRRATTMAGHGRAPHGGQLAMAGAGHVELAVEAGGTIAVWLYDAALKPMAPPPGASVMLMRGNQMVTLPLTSDAAAGRLTARYDAAAYRAFEAIVRLPSVGAGAPREVTFTVPAPAP